MRRWHRLLLQLLCVTLSYWVVSGLLMAIYDSTDPEQDWAREGGGPGARLDTLAPGTLALPSPHDYSAGIARALQSVADMPIASVDLRMVGATPRLQLATADGERDHERRFSAATGELLDAAVASAAPDAPTPAHVQKRITLKKWHRGNIAGLAGQFIGLLTGLGLIALVLTGIALYLQLWSRRRRHGLGAWFWRTSPAESRWRLVHRAVATIAAGFVLNIAVTGTVLAAGEIKLHLFLDHRIGGPPYPRPTPMPTYSDAVLSRSDYQAMLERAHDAASRAAAGAPVMALELLMRDGNAHAIATLGGAAPRTLAFDASSGVAVSDWRTSGRQQGNGYFADWHQWFKRMHRGDIVGHFAGRYVDLLAGLSLLYLLVSGGIMYLQTRPRAGRAH